MSHSGNGVCLGIDACRGGWMIAAADQHKINSLHLWRSLDDHLVELQSARLIFIDIPIGLPEDQQPRDCDRELRNSLKGRYASSVFSVPVRDAVYADTYQKANTINRERSGKGCSKQSWNICKKVKEVDQFLHAHPDLKSKMFECHPELMFQLESGAVFEKKKTETGEYQRKALLSDYIDDSKIIPFLSDTLRKDVRVDDILDACINAVGALRALDAGIARIPEKLQYDSNKIPMNIHYPNYV